MSLAAVAQKAPWPTPAKWRRGCTGWRCDKCCSTGASMAGGNLVDRFARDTQPTEADQRTVDPLQWLLADERGQQSAAALATMAARDAEILLLKYAEEWSYHDIARHLGISHSAVEARLHRARQRLREVLTATNVIEV